MLRIGKDKDQEKVDNSSHRPEVPDYSNRNYASYQGTGVEAKPAPEPAQSGSRAMTESETLAKDIKEGTLSGFVGGGTVVTGEANFKAMMRVDGHLSGRVSSSSGTLIVGANGKVDANIEVAIAIIHGTINGDIIATQRLELGRAAKVNGNIQTPSLVIEQGAVFEGSCKMLQMANEADKAKKEVKVEPKPVESKLAEPRPLETPKMPALRADAPKTSDIPAATNAVS